MKHDDFCESVETDIGIGSFGMPCGCAQRAREAVAKQQRHSDMGHDVVLDAVLKDVLGTSIREDVTVADLLGEVMAQDLILRAEMGEKKYGCKLMTHNGRSARLDALQEAYDLVMYLKQLCLEEPGDPLWEVLYVQAICLARALRRGWEPGK